MMNEGAEMINLQEDGYFFPPSNFSNHWKCGLGHFLIQNEQSIMTINSSFLVARRTLHRRELDNHTVFSSEHILS